MKKINQFIDGKEYISKSKRVCDVFNPAKGEKIGETSLANSDDINLVIQSAMSAKQNGHQLHHSLAQEFYLNLKN